MKKLITFVSICIVASLLFSSCGSNLSITKRHYNNGYYVDYGNKQQTVLTPKTVQGTTEEPLNFPEHETAQNTTNAYSDQNAVKNNDVIVTNNEKKESKATSLQNLKQTLKEKAKITAGLAAQFKNDLIDTKKINKRSENGEGLSLFWVVILILLILWALGVLSAGFVVGAIINLLLLIALILLILWLLRVI